MNRYNSQLEFSKYQKGLLSEVSSMGFETDQEITNYVRSKMNKIWSDKDKLIQKALKNNYDLKAENKILKDVLEQCLYYTAMRDPDVNTHRQACDSVESISKEALEKIK